MRPAVRRAAALRARAFSARSFFRASAGMSIAPMVVISSRSRRAKVRPSFLARTSAVFLPDGRFHPLLLGVVPLSFGHMLLEDRRVENA
jgi:hypothetical protein